MAPSEEDSDLDLGRRPPLLSHIHCMGLILVLLFFLSKRNQTHPLSSPRKVDAHPSRMAASRQLLKITPACPTDFQGLLYTHTLHAYKYSMDVSGKCRTPMEAMASAHPLIHSFTDSLTNNVL